MAVAHPRDLLLGGLLAVDGLLADVAAGLRTVDESLALLVALADLLAVVADDVARTRAVVQLPRGESEPESRPPVGLGYGIPAWLTDHDPSGEPARGLGALIRQDLGGDGPAAWQALVDHLDQHGRLAPLYRVHELLEGSPLPPDAKLAAGFARRGPHDVTVSASAPLAAAGSAVSWLDEAERAQRSSDPLAVERGWRLQRVDVPVVRRSAAHHGVLVGLDLCFSEGAVSARADRAYHQALYERYRLPSAWRPVTDRFHEGVQRGHAAAVALLQNLGVPPEQLAPFRQLTYRACGALPPMELDEESAGLAVALHVLARVTGLPGLPLARPSINDGELEETTLRRGVVASGVLSESAGTGLLVKPPAEDAPLVAAKARAVQDDGVHSYLLASGGGDSHVLHPGRTLQEAAERVWGEAWRDWIGQVRSSFIGARHVRLGWSRGQVPPAVGSVVVVPEQVERLVQHYTQRHPALGVLGGEANSGKTWIAWLACQSLSLQQWRTCVLTLDDRALPSPDELVALVRHALEPEAASPKRTLVVLEDLEAEEGAADLDRSLEAIRQELGVSVLAVARYDEYAPSEWRADTIRTFPSIVGREVVANFAAAYIDASGGSLEAARPSLATIVAESGGDLWWVTQLLHWAAAKGRGATSATTTTGIRQAFLQDRLGDLSWPGRQATRRLAALSYLQVPVEEASLWPLGRNNLRELGVRPAAKAGTWMLASRATAMALLTSTSNSEPSQGADPVEAAIVSIVNQRLADAIAARRSRDQEVMAIVSGAARTSDAILEALLRARGEQLAAGWAHGADPPRIARILLVAGEVLRPIHSASLARSLCAELPASAPTAAGLRQCLRALRRYRHHIEDEHDDRADLGEVVDWLRDGGLRGALRRATSAAERSLLLREVFRFETPATNDLVLRSFADALIDLQPERAEDYQAAQHVNDLVSMAGGDRGTVARLEPVRRLLAAQPSRSAPAGLMVNWLVLRMVLGEGEEDWDQLAVRYQGQLHHSLRQCSPRELAATLHELASYHRGFAVRLLNKTNLAVTIGAQIDQAPLGEAAILLGTVANIHAFTARDVLYNVDNNDAEPRRDRARRLAERVHADADAKGAGQILAAASRIDILYGWVTDGFAHHMAEHIGLPFVARLLELDPRPSVLYYLLRGLVSANASYLPALEQAVRRHVSHGILHGTKAWAPRLALLLGQDEVFGEPFLLSLRDELSEQTLLARMQRTRAPEALASYHQLGRIIYPDLPSRFAADLHPDWPLGILAVRPPHIIARVCVEVTRTLRAAGVPAAGKMTLDVLGWDWTRQLVQSRNPGDMAETLRLLVEIDPDRVAAAVRSYGGRSRRNQPGLSLEQRLLRSLTRPSAAIELLSAINEAAPGQGTALLAALRRRRPAAWLSLCREVAHLQEPREQSINYLKLAELGYAPATNAEERLVRQVYERWRAVLAAIRSPAALALLLRVFAAWDLQQAGDAARLVSVGALRRRLRQGMQEDLRVAWELLSALQLLGQTGKALDLVDELLRSPAALAEQLGMQALGRTLEVLAVLDPTARDQLAEAALDEVARAARRRVVIDTTEHWLGIGWVARQLGAASPRLQLPGERPQTLERLAATATCWGVGWLHGPSWITETLDVSLGQLTGAPPRQPAAAAGILAVAARHGRAADLVLDQAAWSVVAEAPFRHLLALAEVAAGDETAGRVLEAVAPRILDRAGQPDARVDPAAARLRRRLAAESSAGAASEGPTSGRP